MEADDRLEMLCEEFSDLEESEKDYILGVSLVLVGTDSIKDDKSPKSDMNLEFLA